MRGIAVGQRSRFTRWEKRCSPQPGERPDLLEEGFKIRARVRRDLGSLMPVIWIGGQTGIMRGIVVAKEQGGVLEMVAIAQPDEGIAARFDGLTDLHKGSRRPGEFEAQVGPIRGEELLQVEFNLRAGNVFDNLAGELEIALDHGWIVCSWLSSSAFSRW